MADEGAARAVVEAYLREHFPDAQRISDGPHGERSTHWWLVTTPAIEVLLHVSIATVCVDLYRDGHYRNAVLDASVALVNLVKEKSRKHELDGAPLMTTVFSKNKPLLAFNDLKDRSDEDEQEGMMYLFMGVTLGLRNPRAHALLDDSPEMALEYIALISMLAKRVDQAKRRP